MSVFCVRSGDVASLCALVVVRSRASHVREVGPRAHTETTAIDIYMPTRTRIPTLHSCFAFCSHAGVDQDDGTPSEDGKNCNCVDRVCSSLVCPVFPGRVQVMWLERKPSLFGMFPRLTSQFNGDLPRLSSVNWTNSTKPSLPPMCPRSTQVQCLQRAGARMDRQAEPPVDHCRVEGRK